MSIILTLDSSYTANPTRTHNFETTFQQPIEIKEVEGKKWVVSLAHMSTYFQWSNMSAARGNNLMAYSPDSGFTFIPILFQDGNYSIQAINGILHDVMIANNHFTVDPITNEKIFDIELVPNFSTFRLEIKITDAFYQLDIGTNQSRLHELFGFTLAQVATPLVFGNNVGGNLVNITDNVNSLLVRSSIVEGSYLGTSSSDTLLVFAPQVAPGSSIVIEPASRTFVSVADTHFIRSIRIFLTDQSGTAVDLNGEKFTVQLVLKQIDV